MSFRNHLGWIPTALVLAVLAGPSSAQDHSPDRDAIADKLAKQQFSPYVGRDFPTRVLFGETHLHTAPSGAQKGKLT